MNDLHRGHKPEVTSRGLGCTSVYSSIIPRGSPEYYPCKVEDDEDSDNDNFALHNPNAHINRHCLPLNRTTQHLKLLPKLETGALRDNGALEPNQQTRGQNCIERSTMHGDLCIGVTQKCRLVSISLDFKLKKPKRPSRHRHISSPLVKSPA